MADNEEREDTPWEERPEYNRPYDWEYTITVPTGIYNALVSIELAAEALFMLDGSVSDEIRQEKRENLFNALQYYKGMRTLQLEKGLAGNINPIKNTPHPSIDE